MFRFSSILLLGAVFMPRLEAEEWFPYLESEGRVSNERSVVRGNIFAPVWQSEDSFFFFDIRGLTTNQDANEGNLGFGYRKLIGPDRIIGLFGYYDFRETEFGNQYHQGSLGAELLSSTWGVRVNGYLPEDAPNVVSRFNTAFLSGNNVFVRQGLEAAYWGADIELERMLWSNTDNGKGGNSPLKVAEFDAEWWASIGYFHFDRNGSQFESIAGPRARTELRLWNLPLLGNDSRVMLTGQYDYDDVRGSVGTAGLSVRIPIGRYQSTAAPLSGIRRRMLESVVRDIDIVTNAGAFGDPERAKFARTGELINRAVSVDGNTADPEAVIEGAGDNSLVLASGSAGIISPAGTVDMNTGQVILGGGSVIGVVGCDTGARANFSAPGSRPTFRSGMNDSFVGATNGAIIGVDFGSASDGPVGLILNDVNNFLLDDVVISTVGVVNEGDAIRAVGSSFEVSNSTFQAVGNRADGIDAENSNFAVRGSMINAGDDGIEAFESTVTISDSTVISEDDNLNTIRSIFSISGSTFITNAFQSDHSLIDDFQSQFTIADSSFILNGTQTLDAIGLDRTRSFVMTDSTVAINNGAVDGFQVENVPVFTLANSGVIHNGVTNQTFDFDFSVDSVVNISNTEVRSVGIAGPGGNDASVFDLDTTESAVVNATITDSVFAGHEVSQGVFGQTITSFDSSNLTFNLLRTTVTASGSTGMGIRGVNPDVSATLNLNIIDSTITSLNDNGIETLISNEAANFNVNILRSTIRGQTSNRGSSAGIGKIEAALLSEMTLFITDSNISGGGNSGNAIDDLQAIEFAGIEAVFTRSSFIGSFNSTSTTGSSEGIEDIRASEDALMNLTIVDSDIRGFSADSSSPVTDGPAIGQITANSNSRLRFSISGSTLTSGANAYAARIRAIGGATVIGSWSNNIFTATDVGLLTTTEDFSSVSLELIGNTFTSGAAVNDIELIQTSGTLNVVDFPDLSPNNNNATIGTTGMIGNITTLP